MRAETMEWLEGDQERAEAVWVADESRPLRWRVDGQQYAPTALIREIVRQATGTAPGAMWGTRWWVDAQGRDLVQLAALETET